MGSFVYAPRDILDTLSRMSELSEKQTKWPQWYLLPFLSLLPLVLFPIVMLGIVVIFGIALLLIPYLAIHPDSTLHMYDTDEATAAQKEFLAIRRGRYARLTTGQRIVLWLRSVRYRSRARFANPEIPSTSN
jgi:hypothetical protein